MIILLVTTIRIHCSIAVQQAKVSLQPAAKSMSTSAIPSFTFCPQLESYRGYRQWVVTPVTSPATTKLRRSSTPPFYASSLQSPSSLQSTFFLLCPSLLLYRQPTTSHQHRHHQGTKHEKLFLNFNNHSKTSH